MKQVQGAYGMSPSSDEGNRKGTLLGLVSTVAQSLNPKPRALERDPAKEPPTWRFMGLSKYSYKHLNWGFSLSRNTVSLFMTPVTKSHGPPSRPYPLNPYRSRKKAFKEPPEEPFP